MVTVFLNKIALKMAKKGLKVTNLCRDKKIGVAAESLNELLKKSCDKLMVKDKWQACKCHVAEDGTLVDDDDYFRTLPAQTLLVIVLPEEIMKTDFEHLYDMIRSTTHEYLTAGQYAQEFFSKNIGEKLKKLQEYIDGADEEKVRNSDRNSDPQWFEGIDTNDKTKEAVMNRKAKDRMKGYFYKVKHLLTNSGLYTSQNSHAKTEINLFLKALRNMLDVNAYNGRYFDRSSKETERLCNEDGLFECGGLWSLEQCKYSDSHFINPYRSREERILFQTWNLDHRIELSRSIVPSVMRALELVQKVREKCYSCGQRVGAGHVSANWYYKELFTTENLKLVHIVCHDKAKHDATSDYYIVCERCWKNEGSK